MASNEQKLLLWGGLGVVGLLLLFGGSSSASAQARPPLPAPAPRVMPPPPDKKPAAGPAPKPKGKGKVLELEPVTIQPSDEAQAEADRLAAARAAAAAAAAAERGAQASLSSAVSSPLTAPLSEPAASLPMAVPSAPSADSNPSRPQPGFDPLGARKGSSSVANNLKRAGRAGYDRRLLKSWQTKAGLAADGVYGGATRGALMFFGVKDPPQPFFKGADGTLRTIPYVPPAA